MVFSGKWGGKRGADSHWGVRGSEGNGFPAWELCGAGRGVPLLSVYSFGALPVPGSGGVDVIVNQCRGGD